MLPQRCVRYRLATDSAEHIIIASMYGLRAQCIKITWEGAPPQGQIAVGVIFTPPVSTHPLIPL